MYESIKRAVDAKGCVYYMYLLRSEDGGVEYATTFREKDMDARLKEIYLATLR